MTDDPRWPRASAWLSAADEARGVDLVVLGVPASRTSISPTHAHLTPNAIREALARYSTYSWTHGVDVGELAAFDAGDVLDPEGPEGEDRVVARVHDLAGEAQLLIALGGDNSITYSVAQGAWGTASATAGLVTLDAHHDLREGTSNGSPVRRLVEAGLSGTRVVQIGIADFSNSRDYAARARDLGITVVTRDSLRRRPLADIVAEAMGVATSGGGPVHVDLDVDVCDRAVVPGCPAAAPGGISADELRQLAFLLARSPRVRSLDITEIDAASDAPDGRTVRLGALLVLEAAAALALR
ncbi:MAG: formimidoylglutamase [Actinomycetales bacterium]|nr:formimidoylglutamase [Actinomycetales bacterium]